MTQFLISKTFVRRKSTISLPSAKRARLSEGCVTRDGEKYLKELSREGGKGEKMIKRTGGNTEKEKTGMKGGKAE